MGSGLHHAGVEGRGEEPAKLAAVWRPRARRDMESIIIYKGEVQGQPAAARKLYEKICDVIDLLCATPGIGKPFADARLNRQGYRSFLVGRYRVFYSHDEEELLVWRIVHTRQEIDEFEFVDLP